MKVLVCGGRFYRDSNTLNATLDGIHRQDPITEIIHGCAGGADVRAGLWAIARGIAVSEFPARWDRFGHRAGPLRNREMLDRGQPRLVVAFPGGRGTADTVRCAKRRGVPVLEVGDTPALYGMEAASARGVA